MDRVKDTATDLRRFTRNFTRATGLLRGKLYDVDLSLTEARILYEVAQTEGTTAEAIRQMLGIDRGYLSRSVGRLEKQGWLQRHVSPDDRRARSLMLTQAGRELFSRIDNRSTEEMDRLVAHLGPAQQAALSAALCEVESLLALAPSSGDVTIRPHQVGDMGWIIHRHGLLYHQEYGWNIRFEAAVARIAADFIEKRDPSCEECFIAEKAGAIVGSATVVRHDETTAKLRIVYVEPRSRGHGIGEKLVATCMQFARDKGYKSMVLWTNDVLKPARRLYERLGFTLVESEPHTSFGKDLVGEIWSRDLQAISS